MPDVVRSLARPLVPLLALGLVFFAAPAWPGANSMTLMDWPDLLGRPMPEATERIAYGSLPEQVADLLVTHVMNGLLPREPAP